jgi:hypothetical protein
MGTRKKDSAKYVGKGRGRMKKKEELELLEKLYKFKKDAVLKASKYLGKIKGELDAKSTD